MSGMKRRSFLLGAGGAAAAVGMQLRGATGGGSQDSPRGSFALDGTQVRLFSPTCREAVRILMVADTHLFRDDQRGAPFIQFSGRMARAYNQTKHFTTGEATDPEQAFAAALNRAREWKPELLALVGVELSSRSVTFPASTTPASEGPLGPLDEHPSTPARPSADSNNVKDRMACIAGASSTARNT